MYRYLYVGAFMVFFYTFTFSCWAQNTPDTTLLNLAGTYMDSSSYQQALDTYVQLTVQYPQSAKLPEAIYYIGKCQYRLGDFDLAEQVFNRLLSKYSTSSYYANAERMLGYVLLEKGDYWGSLDAFEKFVQDHPRSSMVEDAQRRIAGIKHKLGKLAEAVGVCDSILNSATASDSTKAEAQMQKGGLLFEIALGEDLSYHGPQIGWDTVRHELSKVQLYTVAESRPSKARASIMTGESYFYEGKFPTSIAIMQSILSTYSDFTMDAALAHYALGRNFQILGECNTALMQFNFVVNHYHESNVSDASLMSTVRADCWFEIATCSFLLGDTSMFEYAVNQVLENYPDACVTRYIREGWGITSPFHLLVKKPEAVLARNERDLHE